jgi:hypothetical protein
VGTLLGLALRRKGGRRGLTGLISVLVVAAVGMLAFPSFTDWFQRHRQATIENKFSQPAFKTVYRQHRVAVGDGLTRLVIDNPRVKVNVLVVEGTTVAALRAGAGHYPATPYPCGRAGNVGIAGHRTTYGRRAPGRRRPLRHQTDEDAVSVCRGKRRHRRAPHDVRPPVQPDQ